MLRVHTSLSFGITTEKQHSHLHEKSSMGKRRGGGKGEKKKEGEVGDVLALCGKGNLEKTDNNGVIYSRKQPSCLSHPVIKVHGYKVRQET